MPFCVIKETKNYKEKKEKKKKTRLETYFRVFPLTQVLCDFNQASFAAGQKEMGKKYTTNWDESTHDQTWDTFAIGNCDGRKNFIMSLVKGKGG